MTQSGLHYGRPHSLAEPDCLPPVDDGAPVGGCLHAQLQRRLPDTKEPFEERALVWERGAYAPPTPGPIPSDQQRIMLMGPGGEFLGVADVAEGGLGVGVTQQSLEDEQGPLV